jgi:hypothetical protein
MASGLRGSRRGSGTVEVLVCLLLMALVVQLSWSLLASARATTSRLIQRSEALDAERLGWHVLSREVGAGVPSRDWTVESARVLPLRAFRGLAEVCAQHASADGALVRYDGMRLPEPAKDSLLALSDQGEWLALRLTSRSPSSLECPAWPGAAVERWSWEPAQTGVVLARVFERGSYHLEDRAIRYRTGDGGRQPLSEERLESGSAFLVSAAGLDLHLRLRVDERTRWDSSRRLVGAAP